MLATYLFLTMLVTEPKLDLVKVYCYSVETEAGFIDEDTEKWCKNLNKNGNKKGILTVVDFNEDSDIFVMHGDLTSHASNSSTTHTVPYTNVQITESGSRVYMSNATLVVGEFTKSFQNAGDVSDKILNWIELNQAIILEKTRKEN